jgi:predicted transport protein
MSLFGLLKPLMNSLSEHRIVGCGNMERKKISLTDKDHKIITEKIIQDIIADRPEILGLGEGLTLVGKEMNQKKAGRIDLLFQENKSKKIYEVEIQLGKLNESHLLRAVGYWNIERKKSPDYEHSAVVIAEVVESRMLDLIELYKENVSIIVLQMTAYKIENEICLTFKRKENKRNITDDDNKDNAVNYEYKPFKEWDRQYWENKVSEKELMAVDKIHSFLKEIDSNIRINYTEKYIGFKKKFDNFVFIVIRCTPISKSVLKQSSETETKIKVEEESDSFVFIEIKQDTLILKLALEKSSETETRIEKAGLNLGNYSKKRGEYPIKITKDDIKNKESTLKKLLKQTYEYNMKNKQSLRS